MNEILLDAIRHNNWATRRLIEFCQAQNLPPDQLEVPGVGTFGGILATLRHIVDCDGSYAQRLAGAELPWVHSEGEVDLQELLARASASEQVWEDILAKPIDAERVIVVDQETREVRAGIFLAQALNHANHHREQVCAILTAFGIQPPDIQAWEYAWATARIWDRP
ncbi:putative damage-inducible protein DinB [Nonomuraea thailandensis]|uniref:Damage-inducible protein DinB n=1 Tax=Nonomuraea thailandensis TaxID=1188745 RepID=A0A9X2JZW3_9ACTN|nr:DinB family protein [Nonomuraea thailandensis]MCP2354190.1 putative damage-inducible protein DinB [Nonomuraea thailandensis]